MNSNIYDVIENAEVKKQVDREMFRSMIEFLFKNIRKEMTEFNELSFYLPGLFIIFYGKSRLIKYQKELIDSIKDVENGTNKFKYSLASQKGVEEAKKKLIKVNYLINRYDEYIKEKREIKSEYRKSKNNVSEYQGIPSGEL